jgi:DNA/RNA endonuclease YhcR with UshA esterase domain
MKNGKSALVGTMTQSHEPIDLIENKFNTVNELFDDICRDQTNITNVRLVDNCANIEFIASDSANAFVENVSGLRKLSKNTKYVELSY